MEQFEYRVCEVTFQEGAVNGSFRMWIVPDALPLQDFCNAEGWELFQVIGAVAVKKNSGMSATPLLAVFRRHKKG